MYCACSYESLQRKVIIKSHCDKTVIQVMVKVKNKTKSYHGNTLNETIENQEEGKVEGSSSENMV